MEEKFPMIEGAEVIVQVIDKETGEVVEERKEHNLIVNRAKKQIASILMDGDYYHPLFRCAYIKIGTNGTAPSVEDTNLTEPYRSASLKRNEWNETEGRRELEALFTDFTEEVHICEAGAFAKDHRYCEYNDFMINRVTFSYVTVNPSLNLKVIMYFYPNI